MAEHNEHGNMIAIAAGGLMGFILQIQAPLNEFILRSIIGGVIGATAAWLAKKVLDYLIWPAFKWTRKKLASKEPEIKYKTKK